MDYLLPHQANGRMNELLASEFEVSAGRIFVNADRVGNTGSAAIVGTLRIVATDASR